VTVYTLFGQTGGGGAATDISSYTMGMQFTLSQNATLTGIWFYSAATATVLPTGCAVYLMTGAGTGSIVSGSQNNSPSWSGAAGSGWVKCAYASGPTLSTGNTYKVVVLIASQGSPTVTYSATSHYWDSGAGSGGLTSGIITAPNNAGGDGGQDTFANPSASLAYPASSFNATNYWVDVEVTTGGSPQTATASLTVTPAFATTNGYGIPAALTVTPAFAVKKAEGHKQAMTVTPAFQVSGQVSGPGAGGGPPDRHHRRGWTPR
jgi:uncharacterized protein DUF4082